MVRHGLAAGSNVQSSGCGRTGSGVSVNPVVSPTAVLNQAVVRRVSGSGTAAPGAGVAVATPTTPAPAPPAGAGPTPAGGSACGPPAPSVGSAPRPPFPRRRPHRPEPDDRHHR